MKKTLATLLAALLTVSAAAACQPGDDTDATTTAAAATTTTAGEEETDPPVATDEPTEDETDEPTVEATDPEETDPEETDSEGTDPEDTEPETPDLDLGGRTVRMSAWWDLEPVPGGDALTDQLIDRYAQMEEDYNFTFEYLNIPFDDYQRLYITNAMAGDSIADIAVVEYSWLYPNLAMNNFAADVSELEAFDFSEEKWNQDYLDMSTFDGKTYGFDVGRTYPVGIMFWNKTMFEREGLPSLYDDFFNDEWTWDKMLEYAEALTQDTDGDGVTDQWGLSGTILLDAFPFSNGGQVVDMSDPMNPRYDLLSDNALEGLQALQDFVQTHQVVELNPDGAPWDYPQTQFANGNVGMFVGHWWMVDSILENMSDEYGVVLFPKGPQADKYTSVSTATNVQTIPETVEDKEAIAAIWDMRTDPLPDESPDDWRIYFEDRLFDNESIEVIRMLQEDGLTIINPVGNFSGLLQVTYDYNHTILNGLETPQAAISARADQAQNIIDTAMQKDPDEIVDDLTPEETEEETEEGD